MGDGPLAEPVGAPHAYDVVSWFREDMGGGGESVFGERHNVAIGPGRGGRAIAEGPGLLALNSAERPDFKGDRLSRRDTHGGPVRGLNRRRHLLRMFRIEHVDRLEIVSRATLVIGDLQNFAERASVRVRPLNSRTRGFLPIGESPLVAGYVRRTPRPRPIQSRLFSYEYGLVRPHDGNQRRL